MHVFEWLLRSWLREVGDGAYALALGPGGGAGAGDVATFFFWFSMSACFFSAA